jgi:hypothetical protein
VKEQIPIPKQAERASTPEERMRRFPFALGGHPRVRRLSARKRLDQLKGNRSNIKGITRFLRIEPTVPRPRESFSVRARFPIGLRVALVSLEVRFPSGTIRRLDRAPTPKERANGDVLVSGFESAKTGDLYVSATAYFEDGSSRSDARLTSIISTNPDHLTVTPREWLASGLAGRVEYDWDTNQFHCRAYATITNGSSASRTYRRCNVRVTDGGVGGTLIDAFSFNVGPFTVASGDSAYRSIDTWYPQGSNTWDKFNRRWDLTVQFQYESDGGILIDDAAAYRPMSTVPLNPIKTTDFTGSQTTAERDAVGIATGILEARDVTLYDPNYRILSNQADKDRFGMITIAWSGSNYDFDEASDMYEQISGPDGDRLDLFIPLGFDYTPDVPADQQNVGGFSTVNGPYPKDDQPRRSGCLVLLDENDHEFFGVAIAHETCHYLGLNHVDAEDNLMQENGGVTGHNLTWEQWDAIRQHGMMKWLAPDI